MSSLLPSDWARFRWENSYARLPAALHRRQEPTPVRAPGWVICNERLAEALGLDLTALASEHGAAFLAGNRMVEGLTPTAQAYAGHQFGHFTILGDGRAILLGEHRLATGKLVDIQLKGPGRTDFSRGGDGRLALGPALREFLISEAMAALGVPTTRSLAVVSTGEEVYREEVLPGAVLTRVASSHVRVGTFQYALVTREQEALQSLLEYAIARHYSDLGPEDRPMRFFERVIDRQAALVAKWLSVGFIHGVMNTDNMTVSGETIDFGPCAFLDTYDPNQVFSSIDRHGRYAYGQQPGIAGWNLARLGETLIPLLGKTAEEGAATANAVLATFSEKFASHLTNAFGAKLGIANAKPEDGELLEALLNIAQRERYDFHQLWIDLTDGKIAPALAEWATHWQKRLQSEGTREQIEARMRSANPIAIARNHRVEHALAEAQRGDLAPFRRLLAALRAPFADTPENRELGAPPREVDPGYRTFCGT